jgi:mannonate dehydratase
MKILKTNWQLFTVYRNYKQSIINLAECGISTVCYNFMPVLDWSRTDLVTTARRSKALRFDITVFAAFELFIFKRPSAEKSYTADQITAATHYFEKCDSRRKKKLKKHISFGTWCRRSVFS